MVASTPQGSLLLMVVQWRDPEVQSKKRREAEALERQQGMDCDDDEDNNKVLEVYLAVAPPSHAVGAHAVATWLPRGAYNDCAA